MVFLKLLDYETEEAEAIISSFSNLEDIDIAQTRKTSSAKRQFLLGRSLVRALLVEVTGEYNWQINTDAKGKPYIVNRHILNLTNINNLLTNKESKNTYIDSNTLRFPFHLPHTSGVHKGDNTENPVFITPHISISHSYKYVACAVTLQGTLGLDIEHHKTRDFCAIANYAFGQGECEAVKFGGEDAFYRIWTLREAMAKATGDGALQGMNGNDAVTFFGNDEKWENKNWRLFYFTEIKHYSIAVAILLENTFSVHMN